MSATSPSPTPAARFTIVLPLLASDAAASFFALTAFGIHFGGTGASGHGLDGHPGWDVEFRQGGTIRAAVDGVVQSVFADSYASGRSTIQLQHQVATGNYRTVYTNVDRVEPGIAAGVQVTRGQALGIAGTIASVARPYATTHFQVDDFSRNEGITNPHATNPEPFLDPSARDLYDHIWRIAAYGEAELTEPFSGNPRDVTFPFSRTWTRESGAHAARLEFTRQTASAPDHAYTLYDAAGTAIERGTIALVPSATGMSTIDLRAASGATRRGVIDIVGDTLRLDYRESSGARPASLSSASVYRTR
ncbi:MAG: M23 family metallopeptidase [Acidobacteria bacterium]|nr:M23 family metallopeptidase [Acidobacteriota bacterium]